jgi:hypothetical protein
LENDVKKYHTIWSKQLVRVLHEVSENV